MNPANKPDILGLLRTFPGPPVPRRSRREQVRYDPQPLKIIPEVSPHSGLAALHPAVSRRAGPCPANGMWDRAGVRDRTQKIRDGLHEAHMGLGECTKFPFMNALRRRRPANEMPDLIEYTRIKHRRERLM